VARENNYSGDMKLMPIEIARKIYEDRYWEPLKLTAIEKMSLIITEELADTAVNMGVGRAGKFLQRSLNVLNDREQLYPDLIVDGQVGSKSLQSLGEYLSHRGTEGEFVLFKMLNCLQGAFYVTLSEKREKDERFIFGWLKNRVS
jgi:lysozyme family protein